jgi:hypothetical protein
MPTSNRVQIIKLSANEILWLKEVYSRSSKGYKFTYRDIWSELHQILPADFKPSKMSSHLISSDGTSIRLSGVIAVVKGDSVLDDIDKVIFSIRENLLQDSRVKIVLIQDIANVTFLSCERVSFILHFLIPEFGHFYSAAAYKDESTILNSISVDGNDSVYYSYIGYPGIEKLMHIKSLKKNSTTSESFTVDEMFRASVALDQILKEIKEDIKELKLGQEIIWTDILAEINELKTLYSLSKRNWIRILLGKITDMTVGGIISETLSKKIIEYIKPAVVQLLE